MMGQIKILESSLSNLKESIKGDFIFFSKIDRENIDYVEVKLDRILYLVYFEATYTIETGHDRHSDKDFEYVDIEDFKILGISKMINDKEFECKSINSNLYIRLSIMAEKVHEKSPFFPELSEVIESKINDPF